jgi:hypothetical protein
VQRPDAEHVVELEAVLGQREHENEKRAGNTSACQSADRVPSARKGMLDGA